jgi:hypothetical protein
LFCVIAIRFYLSHNYPHIFPIKILIFDNKNIVPVAMIQYRNQFAMVFRSNCISPKILILTVIFGQFWGTILGAHSLHLRAKRKSTSPMGNGKIADFSEKIHSTAEAKFMASSSKKGKNGFLARKKFQKEKEKISIKNPIERVVIAGKHNHDFEYFSTIFQSMKGKAHILNAIGEHKYQRYILRKAGENGNKIQKMSGIYAIVLLGESLKKWMGHATITLEYIRYGSLKTNALKFPLEIQNIADDRQIFIFLDPSLKNRKKFIAWKLTLQDRERNLSHTKASFTWEILKGKR